MSELLIVNILCYDLDSDRRAAILQQISDVEEELKEIQLNIDNLKISFIDLNDKHTSKKEEVDMLTGTAEKLSAEANKSEEELQRWSVLVKKKFEESLHTEIRLRELQLASAKRQYHACKVIGGDYLPQKEITSALEQIEITSLLIALEEKKKERKELETSRFDAESKFSKSREQSREAFFLVDAVKQAYRVVADAVAQHKIQIDRLETRYSLLKKETDFKMLELYNLEEKLITLKFTQQCFETRQQLIELNSKKRKLSL